MTLTFRSALSVLAVLGALSAFIYHKYAPDPTLGVGIYHSNSSHSELVFLTSIQPPLAAHAQRDPLSASSSVPAQLFVLPLPADGAPLALIVHGYTEHVGMPWVRQLSKAFLSRHPGAAVVALDYYALTSLSRPLMNVNVLRVSAAAAFVLDSFVLRGLSLSRVHILCFSLGCRVVGSVAPYRTTTPLVGRITGIDGAIPWDGYLDHVTPDHHLDDTDAEEVVLLRTSRIGSGAPPVLRDFTFGDGTVQDGCYRWWKPLFLIEICSHYRSLEYVTEALGNDEAFAACPCEDSAAHHAGNDEAFPACPCEDPAALHAGACRRCIAPVHFMQSKVPVGKYFIITSDTSPYSL